MPPRMRAGAPNVAADKRMRTRRRLAAGEHRFLRRAVEAVADGRP